VREERGGRIELNWFELTMSDVYRERLARMAGGGGSGGGDSKASSSALRRSRPSRSETTASRVVATRGPSGPSAARNTSTSGSISSGGSSGRGYQSSSLPMEYKQMKNEMNSHSSGAVVSTRSDAAALQNDLAQRFNLSNAVRPSQKVHGTVCMLNIPVCKSFNF
jgi:hypothetical protein